MTGLPLTKADAIIAAALDEGGRLDCKPLAVAVLDGGGHLVAFKRQDNCGIMRFDIAFAKAWGALGMGRPSRRLADQAIKQPHFAAALVGVSAGRYVPMPGGVLVRDAKGELIGAVGISGDSGENDEACAVAGIHATGLTAETE